MQDLSKQETDTLRKLWYDPKTGFNSARSLYYVAKDTLKNLTMAQTLEWLKSQEVWQRHQPQHKPRDVGAIIPSAPHQIIQIDLIDMSSLKSPQNKNTTFILTGVDTFSKRIWAIPMKSKDQDDSSNAIEELLSDMHQIPAVIMSDNGLEFANEHIKKLLSDLHIKQVFSRPSNPRTNGFVERANGTLKRMLFKYMTSYDTKTYLPALEHLVNQYNSTPQSVTGFAPLDIENLKKGSPEFKIIRDRMIKAAEKRGTPVRNSTFEVGDEVRIQLTKGKLDKSYTVNWTDYTLPIEKILRGSKPYSPDRFLLSNGNKYYAEELLLTRDIQGPPKRTKDKTPMEQLNNQQDAREPAQDPDEAPVPPRPKRQQKAPVPEPVLEARTKTGRRSQALETGNYRRPSYKDFIKNA